MLPAKEASGSVEWGKKNVLFGDKAFEGGFGVIIFGCMTVGIV